MHQLKNLETINSKLNQFKKSIITLWPETIKEWKKGQHLYLKNDKSSYSAYCTTHSTSQYFDEDLKKLLFIGKKAVFYFDDQQENHLKILFYNNEEVTHSVEIIELDDYFIVNGEKKSYVDPINFNGYLTTSYFEMCSVVASCKKWIRKMGNKASNQNSIAQAARRTKIWLEMTFDSPNGLNVEKKSALDAFKIIKAKYGYDKNVASFYRMINKMTESDELRFEHTSTMANVSIKLWCDNTHYNSNTIIQLSVKNQVQNSSINVGVITPNDNTKSTRRRKVTISGRFLKKWVKFQQKLFYEQNLLTILEDFT